MKYFLWLRKGAPLRFKAASTQLDLDTKDAAPILAWTRAHIAAPDLRADGVEEEPHITVKYGLLCEAVDAQRVLRDFGSIPVQLGTLDTFDTNPDFDVLICRVDSPRLYAAHALLSQDLRWRETFPNYQPHLTLAYVAKGACREFVGQAPFAHLSPWFTQVMFSDRSGAKVPLALRSLHFEDDDPDTLESGLGQVFPPRAPEILRVLNQLKPGP